MSYRQVQQHSRPPPALNDVTFLLNNLSSITYIHTQRPRLRRAVSDIIYHFAFNTKRERVQPRHTNTALVIPSSRRHISIYLDSILLYNNNDIPHYCSALNRFQTMDAFVFFLTIFLFVTQYYTRKRIIQ